MDKQYKYTGSRPSILLGGEMARYKMQEDFDNKLRTCAVGSSMPAGVLKRGDMKRGDGK